MLIDQYLQSQYKAEDFSSMWPTFRNLISAWQEKKYRGIAMELE